MKALTVVQPLGDYQRGSQITDEKKIDEILDSPQSANVVRCEIPDAPAQEPPADPGDHE